MPKPITRDTRTREVAITPRETKTGDTDFVVVGTERYRGTVHTETLTVSNDIDDAMMATKLFLTYQRGF